MNVATMTMPREAAREKLKHYRKQLHRRADSEFQAAAEGYAALAEGKVLLNLDDVIGAAPTDEKGRPRLAVARADRHQVRMHWTGDGRIIFDAASNASSWNAGKYAGMAVMLDMRRPPEKGSVEGFALVPMTPADVLNEAQVAPTSLREYHVLWEVEAWADRRIRAAADRDPYLLKHLTGSLYVVVAEWDLTDLERAIMSGRRDA